MEHESRLFSPTLANVAKKGRYPPHVFHLLLSCTC